MVETWYIILAFTLIVYLVLDGRNFGAGAIGFLVARTSAERRQVTAAIGPLWTWHEVWLLVTGGVLFAIFPKVMATAFTGYYLAIFLLLWSLILRGVSLEIGSHIDNALWQQFWDFIFAVSSTALALLFGVALGNLARGVPLDGTGDFQMAFFTDFRVTGNVGLLDWYTISMGVFFLLLLCAHGTTYLTAKTEGPVHDRSRRLAGRLWVGVGIGLISISIATAYAQPALLHGMAKQPIAWLALVVVFLAGATIAYGTRRGNEIASVAGATLFIGGFLAAAAASMFPYMLVSTLGIEHSLTAYNSSASRKGMAVGLVWWPVAFVLSCSYCLFIHRKYRGKVKLSDELETSKYP